MTSAWNENASFREQCRGTITLLSVFGAGTNSAMLVATIAPNDNSPNVTVAAYPFKQISAIASRLMPQNLPPPDLHVTANISPSDVGTEPPVFGGFVTLLAAAYAKGALVTIEYDAYPVIGNIIRCVTL